MLKIEKIGKTFNKGTANENYVLKGLSLDVKEGDFITIIGGNGAGKSTLLNVISGSIGLDSGSIKLDSKEISNMAEYKRTKDISRVFQDPSLGVAPSMTILENMSMAYNKGKPFGLSRGISKKNIEYFKELLSSLDLKLEDKLENSVGLLSGGQRQSLSLIMSMMQEPKLLLLDEHTAALDPKTSKKILEITKDLISEKKVTTLMVTHDLNHVLEFGDRVIMMHLGEIILDIKGKEKEDLTIERLLDHFENANVILSDRTMLGN